MDDLDWSFQLVLNNSVNTLNGTFFVIIILIKLSVHNNLYNRVPQKTQQPFLISLPLNLIVGLLSRTFSVKVSLICWLIVRTFCLLGEEFDPKQLIIHDFPLQQWEILKLGLWLDLRSDLVSNLKLWEFFYRTLKTARRSFEGVVYSIFDYLNLQLFLMFLWFPWQWKLEFEF